MRKKSHLSWFILAVFMMTIAFGGVMPNVANAANLTDVQGHWAAAQINAMVDQGIVAGYPNNTFKPNANITRAEFIVLSNKSFAFDNTAEINYSDVKSSDWFANDIAKAKAAGYISGYENGTMKPNNNISRQEAAVIVANILKLNSAGSDELKKFKDASSIPAWSASSVAALVKGGILAGYPDGTFQPKKAITRAEAVVILTKAKGTTTPSKSEPQPGEEPGVDLSKISKAGTYGPETGNEAVSGNVTISAPDVTLQNVTVSGDLTISDAVGNGDVTLKNVTVKGTTYIKGGGANSIHLDGCTLEKVVINKASGNVRVALEGSTSIYNLVVDSEANIVGKGTITKASVNVNGVNIEIEPGTVTVASGKTAMIAGKEVKGASSGGGGTTPAQLTIQASPASGAVAAGTPVYLSSVAGADIYYTTDGSEPKTSSTKYTGAITVNSAMTIRAIAVKSGYTTSAPCSFSYTIKEDTGGLPAEVEGFTANPLAGQTYVTVTLKAASAATVEKVFVNGIEATPQSDGVTFKKTLPGIVDRSAITITIQKKSGGQDQPVPPEVAGFVANEFAEQTFVTVTLKAASAATVEKVFVNGIEATPQSDGVTFKKTLNGIVDRSAITITVQNKAVQPTELIIKTGCSLDYVEFFGETRAIVQTIATVTGVTANGNPMYPSEGKWQYDFVGNVSSVTIVATDGSTTENYTLTK